MSTKNNSGTDIGVLTNFQSMPKRFMAWDKETKEFWYDLGGYNLVFEDEIRLGLWLANRKEVHGLNLDRFIIVQSTNLFDKDGKEIFEGSIVEFEGNKHIVINANGCFIIDSPKLGIIETTWDLLWRYDRLNMKVIGHILSNPELLEEK